MAVESMRTCEDVGELAQELGVTRRCLYKWRAKLDVVESGEESTRPSTHEASYHKQVHQLKRVLAGKTLEVDFFKGTMQKIEARRQKSGADAPGVVGHVTPEWVLHRNLRFSGRVERPVSVADGPSRYKMPPGGLNMPSLPSGQGHGYDAAANLKWSSAEKAIARKAFDQALQRELQAVMTETKKRAAKIQRASDLWDLEHYLTGQRSQIDQQFDYRYSVLIQVFGDLVHRERLSEQELQGLDEDKLDLIRHYAAFLVADSC